MISTLLSSKSFIKLKAATVASSGLAAALHAGQLRRAADLRCCAMHGQAVLIRPHRMKPVVSFIRLPIFLAGLLWAGSAFSMDRFAALSMIESGDDDFANGRHTEVSRFQIRREVWLQTTNAPISDATNAVVARAVTELIAAKRCQDFEKKRGRVPTDFEFYVLWNAPAQVDKPAPAVRARAERFVNLVEKKD